MLFNYPECIKKFETDYNIKKQIENKALFKLESGIYSDKSYVDERYILQKKYPKATYGLNSAFYYHDLTDVIPRKYYLVTDKDSAKIRDQRVVQIFEKTEYLELSVQEETVDGNRLRIYTKEKLLVDLIRYKHRFSLDYYKEIINNYRRIIDELDFQEVQEIAELVPKTDKIINAIDMEVL